MGQLQLLVTLAHETRQTDNSTAAASFYQLSNCHVWEYLQALVHETLGTTLHTRGSPTLYNYRLKPLYIHTYKGQV